MKVTIQNTFTETVYGVVMVLECLDTKMARKNESNSRPKYKSESPFKRSLLRG